MLETYPIVTLELRVVYLQQKKSNKTTNLGHKSNTSSRGRPYYRGAEGPSLHLCQFQYHCTVTGTRRHLVVMKGHDKDVDTHKLGWWDRVDDPYTVHLHHNGLDNTWMIRSHKLRQSSSREAPQWYSRGTKTKASMTTSFKFTLEHCRRQHRKQTRCQPKKMAFSYNIINS